MFERLTTGHTLSVLTMNSESSAKRIKLEPDGSDASVDDGTASSSSEVKQEVHDPISVQEIEDTIMKLCEGQKEGINDSVMQVRF